MSEMFEKKKTKNKYIQTIMLVIVPRTPPKKLPCVKLLCGIFPQGKFLCILKKTILI